MVTARVEQNIATVFIRVDLTAEDRGSYWAGTIEQIGTTVYGDSFEGLKARADEAMAALYKSFDQLDKLTAYLNTRGITYSVRDPSTPPSMRRRHMEIAGEATIPAGVAVAQ